MATQEQELARPSDQEILDFEKIAKADELSKPLVSEIMDFTTLQHEYAGGSAIFQRKIQSVIKECRGMRAIKKDGNCFYRGFGFRLAELVWEQANTLWADTILTRAMSTKELLLSQGYDLYAIEDFYDMFINTFKPQKDKNLLDLFTEKYDGEAIVCYLRLVTAAILKRDRDMYEAFILDSYPSIDIFISNQVEPMAVESDNIHIVAMSSALGVNIKVANLDLAETSGGDINYHEFSPMDPVDIPNQPEVVLMYRPGHYDVIYPNVKT
ncbi:hypothetical protein SmJEL517_g04329 [Synchytrium microbalum]|uniref:ubiquitinyl hydrolase 1 n=1 Tax=Synchytrium microbalum TaxID=1806994 RepID=A0A507C4Y6_9FUNG|nr:uncharacterized protein SmJEL517_g04329 [Synchytrium microbalum]TPX32603.1 hypothetical protein SmJEL517_g04329 [Synchytrium microbalum]